MYYTAFVALLTLASWALRPDNRTLGTLAIRAPLARRQPALATR